jgi:hypothetical protein
MEKFYIVTDKSDVKQDYLDYKQNLKDVNEVVKVVMDANGIEAKEYCIDNYDFAIVGTQADLNKYLSQFRKDAFVGHPCFFKKTSTVYKQVFEALKLKNLKVLHKPMIQFQFHGYGQSRSRLLDIDDIVYASFESEYDFKTPKGFQEIKASEFFKIIEDYNAKIEKEATHE